MSEQDYILGKKGVDVRRWVYNPSTNLPPHWLWIASRCFHPSSCMSSHCQNVPAKKCKCLTWVWNLYYSRRLSVEAAGRPRGSVGSATDGVVRDTALELGPEWKRWLWRSQGPLKPEWFYGSHSSTFLCATWFSKSESLAAKVLQVQITSQGVSLPSSIPLWFLFARSH